MSTILVSGSPAYDRIMDFDGLFRDHILPEKIHGLSVSFTVKRVTENFGGTGGNVAYNLALLGQSAALLSWVGDDFEPYREWLKKHGVSCDYLRVLQEERTASAYVMTDKENNQIAAFHHGAAARIYDGEFPQGARAAIIAPSHPADMVMFAKKYKEIGTPYYLDAGQQIIRFTAEDLRECIDGAAAVFANDYESMLLQERAGWSESDIAQRVGAYVITLGAEGARIVTGEGEKRVDGVQSRSVVDPTGAGDAHRAGFVAAHLAGASPEKAVQVASAVAVYAIEAYGTQNHSFTLDALGERYTSAYGEPMPALQQV
ncbi:carbohydrate kinase family protein [Candidatus Kaiserbacteria bacterium CG10_big_fil_rev_8_21_14_0_10_59_10]|uniref:Carbohydrate kinase family protein n=1 Tax=Candidatus Kaiserbacteria bacterium CG10_big_fil_rev_8_21_14_0_10_59_10 TaxID=1974612 RepID=A0A2H0U6V0_9BACT|nr:MAG: carbohydrate kinase family protein [Candidatus Kaiserbacteria bacterium CG10_big_fil_rev_8_21_14_0_10_59_10]